MSTLLYKTGLIELAAALDGAERVHLGIRPYALHAGNVVAIAAYPFLLCEEFARARSREPRFQFIVSVNDWEQEALGGPDIHRLPLDVHPVGSTIRHARDAEGVALADRWEPRIRAELGKVERQFPHVRVDTVRNSQLKLHPAMRRTLHRTLNEWAAHKRLLLDATSLPTVGTPMRFAAALCPHCRSARTRTAWETEHDPLVIACDHCGEREVAYQAADFWLYHKQLFAARWAIFGYDVAISGADHFAEGDHRARRALYEAIFDVPAPDLKMLFSPLVLDGQKMSKSRGNTVYLPLESVLAPIRRFPGPRIAVSELGAQAVSR